MAVLYRALDEVYYNIVAGTTSASERTLFIPGHFIMGWFASFWRDAPMPTSSAQLVACPPFITDFRNYAAVDIQTAHSFFWEFNNDGTGLRFLVFLGRSEVRFPHSGEAIYICDDRTQYRNSGAITIAAIDMLVSCSLNLLVSFLMTTGWSFLTRQWTPNPLVRIVIGIIPSYGQEKPLCASFFLFLCNQFHTLPFFSCAPARIQQLSNESKKLSINVEHIIAQVSQAVNMNCGVEENFLLKEFDGNNPVTLPKLSDVVSARGLKHRDIILKEISINLDLWSNFFSKPPPEIIRLMEGLHVLKGALSEKAPLPTTNLVLAQQDQINQHVDLLRTTQDKVESSCVALEALTSQYNVEQAVDEGNKREAEIAVLQARLQQVEDAHCSAQHRQDVVTENFNSHLERHRQAGKRAPKVSPRYYRLY
uniref:Aminotransferase-like plant mobile domain-containing protein n=1 Tax=Oryza rufipogon TaxID=4529 RepID=A0A0E0P705_ORYRU